MSAPFFSSIADFNKYLDNIGIFHINPSLDAISKVLDNINMAKPGFAVCQIVGTNGKGSTSSMLSSLCTRHGLKTGLFTSPHFLSIQERILIDKKIINEADWLKAANKVMETGGESLTYFEVLTAIAMLIFKQHEVDIAILEAGLGGTWDTSSAVRSDLTVFTSINMDHQDVLGDTLEKIAQDKSGAIRSDAPVVSCPQAGEVEKILRDRCEKLKSPFYNDCPEISSLDKDFSPEKMLLAGGFQKENASLALKAFDLVPDALKRVGGKKTLTKVDNKSKIEALKKAWIAGRLQRIPAGEHTPPFILDGAHNPHAMAALGLSMAQRGKAPSSVIFTCLKDKEPEKIIAHLKSLSLGPFFIPPLKNNSRAIAPEEIARMIGLAAIPTASLKEALEKAYELRKDRTPEAGKDDFPVLICGSLYLLADFYALYPEYLNPPVSE